MNANVCERDKARYLRRKVNASPLSYFKNCSAFLRAVKNYYKRIENSGF